MARSVLALRRHRLAYLHASAWPQLLSRNWDAEARACLEQWSTHQFPLVMTTQTTSQDGNGADDAVSLGLAASARWRWRRLALQAPYEAIASFGEFPQASEISGLLPPDAQDAWRILTTGLSACRASAYVFGSYGWQGLTGLSYVRATSDVDLWIPVDDAGHADATAALLGRYQAGTARLDGEFLFANGAAVNWREWAAWRAGKTRSLLVKRLDGALLADETALIDVEILT